jgi:hypothetical protein
MRLAQSSACAAVCSGPSFLEALLRSARLGGGPAMLLRAVLAAQASRAAEALGMRSGVEMRAARRAAEALGAQIVLGEQPNLAPICLFQVRMQLHAPSVSWPCL